MNKVTYKTADGQEFVNKNYAILHAKTLSNSTVTAVGAVDAADVPVIALLTKADEIIAYAQSTDDADSLVLYLEAENDRKKPRKTVIDAVEAKLNELNQD